MDNNNSMLNDNKHHTSVSKLDEPNHCLYGYSQKSIENETYINITLTKVESDGSRVQTYFIAKK